MNELTGFREGGRFGLILLGEEAEGGENPAQAKLKGAKSYAVLPLQRDCKQSPLLFSVSPRKIDVFVLSPLL